jgi:hypothetical protein
VAEPPRPSRRRLWWLAIPPLVVGWLVITEAGTGGDAPPEPGTAPSVALTDDDMPAVADMVAAIWDGREPTGTIPSRMSDPAQAVFVATRAGGVRRSAAWRTGGTALDALRDAVTGARDAAGAHAGDVDALEVVLAHSYRALDPVADEAALESNTHRGVRGLEARRGDRVERWSPTYAIASNRGNRRLLDLYGQQIGLGADRIAAEVELRSFEAEQILVELGESPVAHLMLRGNRPIPIEAVDRAGLERMTDLAIGWMLANLGPDGRMTYLYWPSAGREAPGRNNMIRQWMATVALDLAAAWRRDDVLFGRAEQNIDYGLRNFYAEEGDLGLIRYENEVKLGAMSLAALAIVEHPARAKWARQEAALRRTIDSLWHEDGSFETFWAPRGRTDQQNYYPGETLLLWATLYRREPDPALRERFFRSFEYYRRWHIEPHNRNPAFVPWHTQAYVSMWEQTEDERLRDFVFEMNDWLVDQMQQWEGEVTYPDELGRFHNPGRPFGAPHASSDGVYLEGLIDAFKLARAVGDAERQERYRLAILRGLRSLMQLQFADDVDLFYVAQAERDRVRGGMRTAVYDNVIRCDNVQHGLMAMLEILEAFAPEDYRHP